MTDKKAIETFLEGWHNDHKELPDISEFNKKELGVIRDYYEERSKNKQYLLYAAETNKKLGEYKKSAEQYMDVLQTRFKTITHKEVDGDAYKNLIEVGILTAKACENVRDYDNTAHSYIMVSCACNKLSKTLTEKHEKETRKTASKYASDSYMFAEKAISFARITNNKNYIAIAYELTGREIEAAMAYEEDRQLEKADHHYYRYGYARAAEYFEHHRNFKRAAEFYDKYVESLGKYTEENCKDDFERRAVRMAANYEKTINSYTYTIKAGEAYERIKDYNTAADRYIETFNNTREWIGNDNETAEILIERLKRVQKKIGEESKKSQKIEDICKTIYKLSSDSGREKIHKNMGFNKKLHSEDGIITRTIDPVVDSYEDIKNTVDFSLKSKGIDIEGIANSILDGFDDAYNWTVKTLKGGKK